MSEIAGKIATQAGAFMLEKPLGGRGLLLGGVPGVAAGKVMVIGGGVVGQNAAEIAIGMGAETYVYDRSIDRLRELEVALNGRCSTVSLDRPERRADAAAGRPRHRRRPPARRQGAARRHPRPARAHEARTRCSSTSPSTRAAASRPRTPTTHSDPTYEVDGITHYCVANMPGAVPITSTFALTNATMPYVVRLADLGVHRALAADEGFLRGLNVAAGRVTYAPVADDQGLEGATPEEALAAVPAAA